MRQETSPAGENKMGVMPVNRLLITMACLLYTSSSLNSVSILHWQVLANQIILLFGNLWHFIAFNPF